MLPIKVTPIAEAHIQEAASWWLANRDKAPLATNYAKCNTDAMAKSDIDIGRLSPAERLELIDEIAEELFEREGIARLFFDSGEHPLLPNRGLNRQ